MNWRDFMFGAACGIAAGLLAKTLFGENEYISSEEILQRVKKSTGGKIIGTWIIINPETVLINSLSYKAYRGGITQLTESGQKSYEFLADAKTGTIISWEEI